MEKKDISKRTVLVLLVLTLVISVVGTWTILSQPTTIYKTTQIDGPAKGYVAVDIMGEGQGPAPADTNGQVMIKIGETS